MRVAVIGAGVGGLATAIGLQRRGVDAVVFERVARLQQVGSGLSMFGNGRAALRSIGVGEAFDDIAGDAAARLDAGQRTPSGAWLSITPLSALQQLRVVHRADLHRLLVDSLQPGTLQLGRSVHAPSTAGRIEGDDIVERDFDVVVAADGINSRTRALWPNAPGVRYSGYSTWRGITSRPVVLDAAGETWGDGLRFGMAPLADGRVYWFAVATMPEAPSAVGELDRVREIFGGWHDPIPALLESTEPHAVVRHAISDLAGGLRSFTRQRTVLLGDAAHAMTPDLGQGANQALEDAATLSVLLGNARDRDIDAALRRYDELRRPRTQRLAKRARSVGRLAQSSGRLRTMLRDSIVRLTPPRVFADQLESIQSWEPPGEHR